MQVSIVGLDIAKQVFQIHGADANGKILLQKRLRRNQVLGFFANLPDAWWVLRPAEARITG